MTEYLTEQEQIEILKKWIKQYSFVIIAGIALSIAILMGWRYWQQYQEKQLAHASMNYDEMLNKRLQNNVSAANIQAEKIFSHYGRTIYSKMAALTLAKSASDAQDYAKAQQRLNWVISQSKVPAIRQIARIRMARIALQQNQPQEAMDILGKIDDKTFVGLVAELRGDAYLALNKPGQARVEYQKALTELPNAEIVRPVLRMKYDNLAPT